MISLQNQFVSCRKQARPCKPAAADCNHVQLVRRNVLQSRVLSSNFPSYPVRLSRTAARVQAWVTEYQNSIVPAQSLVSKTDVDSEPTIPVYVTLGVETYFCSGSVVCHEALKSGLKALKCAGVHGVVVEVWWGLVEDGAPRQYDWDTYHMVFRTLKELGLKAKACMCYHSAPGITLPSWVLAAGEEDPDIFFTDRNGNRRKECLSLGIDEVPALSGRTATEVYQDFMLAFKQEFQQYFGNTILGALIGMGPDGELKYPAQPRDAGWAFPGVGEFQCYDRFMLASLRACAQAVNQPSWGLGGPHDAGTYCQVPHQTGFFSHNGSWSSPYGTFFLQWYSSLLVQHADRMLSIADDVFCGTGVRLSVKLPAVYWWYDHTCHAAEMTAGINSSAQRDGYLPVMKCLQRWDAVAELPCADMSNVDTEDSALCNPEKLLMQQRVAATALQVPIGLNNSMTKLDEAALNKLEHNAQAPLSYAGMNLFPATSMTVQRVCKVLFEPGNWQVFKAFVKRVNGRADDMESDEAPVAVPSRPYRNASAPATGVPVSESSQSQQVQGSPVWA